MLSSRLVSSCFRGALIAALLGGGSAAPLVAAQGIIGAWSTQSVSAEGANVVVFLANGYYIQIENAHSSAAPSFVDGYEHGSYTWDAGTGAFTLTTLTDTNGNAGLSGLSGYAGVNVAVAGDTLTVQVPGIGTGMLSRVSAANPIVGAWLAGTGTGFAGTTWDLYAFFADGTYLMAAHGPLGGAGIEHGTYAWNASSGAFTSTRTPSPPFVDTNGQGTGLSPLRADATANVISNGTRLVIGDSVIFTSLNRVGPPHAPSAASTVVEYYHAGLGHYFITSLATEIADLDAGMPAGWERTGEVFNVQALNAASASNVCRFFSTSFAPKSSHFYTATECETVMANPDWMFEGEVFSLQLANAAGDCPAGTVALYRMYNNARNGAPNHRYTTRLEVRSQMLGEGSPRRGSASAWPGACRPRGAETRGGTGTPTTRSTTHARRGPRAKRRVPAGRSPARATPQNALPDAGLGRPAAGRCASRRAARAIA